MKQRVNQLGVSGSCPTKTPHGLRQVHEDGVKPGDLRPVIEGETTGYPDGVRRLKENQRRTEVVGVGLGKRWRAAPENREPKFSLCHVE